MIRKIFLSLFLFVISFSFPAHSFAHVLQSDGSIGAVLHVNPEDDPIAGEISNFFFEFKDKENKFLPENCDCKVKIVKDSVELVSSDLFENNSDPSLINASFSYTFPGLGIYSVVVEGKSKDSSFEMFTLKYDVRVARSSVGENSPNTQEANWFLTHKLHIVLVVVLGILTLAVVAKKPNK